MRHTPATTLTFIPTQRQSSILFAANRSPTGHALALAVHKNDDGRWYWIDGENREIALAQGEELFVTAEEAKIAAHKRWKCVGARRFRFAAKPIAAGISALVMALGLASSAQAKPHKPSRKAAATQRFVLQCVDERTGPDDGIDTDEAFKLCRGIARHNAKVEKLAKRAADARLNGAAPRLVKRLEWDCAEEVSIACEDTTERSTDNGECSDKTLEAKHAFDVCRGTKGGK